MMKAQTKSKFKKILRLILAIGLAMLVVIGGWATGFVLHPPHENLWWALLSVTTVIIIAAATVSIVGDRKLNKKINNAQIQSAYEYGENFKTTILSDFHAAKKHVQKTVTAIYFYIAALIVLFLFLNFCIGCVTDHGNFDSMIPMLLFGIISTFCVGGLFVCFLPAVSSDAVLERFRLTAEEFPLLNDIALRAAKTAKCTKPVRLYLSSDGISVQEQKKYISLQINHLYASVLTADELYNVFLHEFAHVLNSDTKLSAKLVSAQERVSTIDTDVLGLGQLLFLRLPAAVLSFKVVSFLAIINQELEITADEFVKANGDPQIYSDALAKSHILKQYEEMPNTKFIYDFYSSEMCTCDYASQECTAFLTKRDSMGKIWEEYLYKELPSKIDSHPTTIARIKNMGCSSFDAYAEETDEFFRIEQQKLIAVADKASAESIAPYYSEYRQQEYLNRKKTIDEYQKCRDDGAEPSESLVLEAAQAFFGLDDEKAIEAADKIIGATPDAPQANFIKGLILFFKYDDNCIQCFKTAAKDYFYAQDAYDFVGRYALKTGNEELLSEYRATVLEIVQEAKDNDKRSKFTRNTAVEPHDLTDDEIEALTKGLVAATEDHISKIYVCKYTDPFGKPHYEVALSLRKVNNTNKMWEILGGALSFLEFHSDKHRFDLTINSYILRRKIIKANNSLIYNRRIANKKK